MHHGKRVWTLLLAAVMLLTCLPTPSAAASFSELLEAASDGDTLTLQQNITENVTVNKNLCIDLNGCDITGTVTVADGCTLYVMDSQTDDYTVEDGSGYGKITAPSGNVLPQDGYMKVAEEDGVSFHKLSLKISSMTLRPECAGIYYNGRVYGDELVAENVKYYGIALRIEQAPDAAYMKTHSAYSRYSGFRAGDDGNTGTGTLLTGVLKTENTKSVNSTHSKLKICGSAYILTNDGEYIFGETVSRSLKEQVQAADAQWKRLTAAQKSAIKAMYKTYSYVMENWYLPNINDTDIDVPI